MGSLSAVADHRPSAIVRGKVSFTRDYPRYAPDCIECKASDKPISVYASSISIANTDTRGSGYQDDIIAMGPAAAEKRSGEYMRRLDDAGDSTKEYHRRAA
jgi:hypothetical protein